MTASRNVAKPRNLDTSHVISRACRNLAMYRLCHMPRRISRWPKPAFKPGQCARARPGTILRGSTRQQRCRR
jgi:hypothetical protein